MMSVIELLSNLEQKGISLSLDNEQLRVQGSRTALNTDDIEALRTHKVEIIHLLHEQQSAIPMTHSLSLQQRPAELLLSFAQERLWFLAQLENTANAYNMSLGLRLHGSLQIKALTSALNTIIERHEILRTTFPSWNGKPQQHIASSFNIALDIIDFSHLPTTRRTDACMQVLHERSLQPFELTQMPLIRAVLVCLTKDDHMLLLCMHHIVSDGWSLGVLTQELDAAYQAAITDQCPTLPPLSLQYADYALWQHEFAKSAEWQKQLDWWQQQLEGTPTLLDLPTDRPRLSVQDSASGTFQLTLNNALTTQLERLGEQQGSSLFMIFFTLWAVLLGRYSNEDDFVIGTPIANRHHFGLDSLMGCFVNTLPLRVDLSGDQSFTGLLARLRQVTLDAYAHQDIPFEQLVNKLQIERSLSHSPLFQIMLSVEYAESHPAARDYSLGDLQASWIDLGRENTELDLGIEWVRTCDGLLGWLDYSKALFDPETIERMAGHFQKLVESVITNPACKIAELPLLTEAEHHQLLNEWNPKDTNIDNNKNENENKSIQQLFEQQIGRAHV